MEIAKPKKNDLIAKTKRLILSFPYLWGVNEFILFGINNYIRDMEIARPKSMT